MRVESGEIGDLPHTPPETLSLDSAREMISLDPRLTFGVYSWGLCGETSGPFLPPQNTGRNKGTYEFIYKAHSYRLRSRATGLGDYRPAGSKGRALGREPEGETLKHIPELFSSEAVALAASEYGIGGWKKVETPSSERDQRPSGVVYRDLHVTIELTYFHVASFRLRKWWAKRVGSCGMCSFVLCLLLDDLTGNFVH